MGYYFKPIWNLTQKLQIFYWSDGLLLQTYLKSNAKITNFDWNDELLLQTYLKSNAKITNFYSSDHNKIVI
jgi:hypothetical protein